MEAGTVVVAAAIVSAGRVLAAQRSYPPPLAGLWELPGGKVAPGEEEVAALRRECREELGVTIEVGGRVGADLPTAGGAATLRVYGATVTAGTPTSLEHLGLRWLGPDELDNVEWLPTDRPLLAELATLLRANLT